nr:Chain D, LEDGF peptide [Homo sapiens]3AVK_F Chain F, LEDGF peptide [Homo sapiens]
SLKIDNED